MFDTPKDTNESESSSRARFWILWLKNHLGKLCDRLGGLITDDRTRRRRIFSDVYKHNRWGKDENNRYYSGDGSRGEVADFYVEQMAALLRMHAAELGRPIAVVDLGCGDFQVGRALVAKVPNLTYVGCDIVPEVIANNKRTYRSPTVSFRELDIVADPLPNGDVYLIRQVFQHLSNVDITAVLRRVNCKYLYVTEAHPPQRIEGANPDHVTGAGVRFDRKNGCGRGVELSQPPWNFATREMFRCAYSPQELLVTEQVFLKKSVFVPPPH